MGITSQRIGKVAQTEFLIKEGTNEFANSGLARTSVVRCEYIMTLPKEIITRKLGKLGEETMSVPSKAYWFLLVKVQSLSKG